MGDCIIAMRSVTIAKKAERALNLSSIGARVVSIDPALTKRGCGYGIALDCHAVDSAERILDKKNIIHGEVLGRY